VGISYQHTEDRRVDLKCFKHTYIHTILLWETNFACNSMKQSHYYKSNVVVIATVRLAQMVLTCGFFHPGIPAS